MFEYSTMYHPCKVLNRISWGAHINPTRYEKFSPEFPDWLNPLQKQEWRERGLVLWDATTKVVTHLYANYALRILETMKDTDTWKTDGYVIGSPMYQMSISDTTDERIENNEHEKDGWVLTNQIKLSPKHSYEFFCFLVSEEKALTLIAAHENKDVCEAYAIVFDILLELKRKKREPQEKADKKDPLIKKITPTSLPKGEYFTIPQIAEICSVSVKQITKWIQKGNIEAIDLPGMGQIVEMEKFTQFLNRCKPPGYKPDWNLSDGNLVSWVFGSCPLPTLYK